MDRWVGISTNTTEQQRAGAGYLRVQRCHHQCFQCGGRGLCDSRPISRVHGGLFTFQFMTKVDAISVMQYDKDKDTYQGLPVSAYPWFSFDASPPLVQRGCTVSLQRPASHLS